MLLKQLTSIDLVAAQKLRDEVFFEPLNLEAEMRAYVKDVCVYGYDENNRWVGPKPQRVACKDVNLSDPDLLERTLQKPDLGMDAPVAYGLFDAEELVGLTIFHSCFNADNSQWLVIDLLAVKASQGRVKEQCAVTLLTKINEQFENQYTSIKLNHRKNFNVAIRNLPIPGNASPLINQEFVPLSVILGEKSIELQTISPKFIQIEESVEKNNSVLIKEEKSAKFPWDKLALLLVVVGGGVIIGLAAAGLFLSLWTIIPTVPLLVGVFIGIKIIYDKFGQPFQGGSGNTNPISEPDSPWSSAIENPKDIKRVGQKPLFVIAKNAHTVCTENPGATQKSDKLW